jgi:hypothetical protein
MIDYTLAYGMVIAITVVALKIIKDSINPK